MARRLSLLVMFIHFQSPVLEKEIDITELSSELRQLAVLGWSAVD
jgi:hypothetical protein